jgi:hypothetical protein
MKFLQTCSRHARNLHQKLHFIRGKCFTPNEVIDEDVELFQVASITGTGLFLNVLIISYKTIILFLSDCELSKDPY